MFKVTLQSDFDSWLYSSPSSFSTFGFKLMSPLPMKPWKITLVSIVTSLFPGVTFSDIREEVLRGEWTKAVLLDPFS